MGRKTIRKKTERPKRTNEKMNQKKFLWNELHRVKTNLREEIAYMEEVMTEIKKEYEKKK
jgi:hypothetical protein